MARRTASAPEAGAAPLLAVTALRTEIDASEGRFVVVDDVSMRVDRGSSLGIVGESGSGKSVLLRSLIGLLPRPTFVTMGSSRVLGTEVVGMDDRRLTEIWGRQAGMVFQDPLASLNPVLTVGAQLGEGMRRHFGWTRRRARARAVELLGELGIPDPGRRVDSFPHELSGGMRQRVMIACALACEPALLLADEPTTALDVTVQSDILALLRLQQAERNMGMIFVSHDLAVVREVCDEIAVMYAGRIVEQAPATVLFDSMRMPYTKALLDAIPDVGDPPHRRLRAIPGQPPDVAEGVQGCAYAPRCPHARERCRIEAPPLVDGATPGHRFACWYPLDIAEAEG